MPIWTGMYICWIIIVDFIYAFIGYMQIYAFIGYMQKGIGIGIKIHYY